MPVDADPDECGMLIRRPRGNDVDVENVVDVAI